MAKSKSKSLPRFGSIDELVDFFETHDMDEYWFHMPEAHFDVSIKRRRHWLLLTQKLSPSSMKLLNQSKSHRKRSSIPG
jgi:hypothetical protein